MLKNKNEKKHMRATRKIALSFLGVIFIGSILLSLPFSNNGTAMPYLDNLFVAASATCVTGLVPTVTVDQYSFIGQVIILILIQVGGLGFLTLLSILVLTFRKKLSLHSRIVIQEALNQPTLNEIGGFIKKILSFTVIVEAIGALLLCFVFVPDRGVLEGVYYSVFHSISAFCNAGFDIIGATSLLPYQTNLLVNIVISGLIISGGLGFIVWFDLQGKVKKEFLRPTKFSFKHLWNTLQLHSKIAIVMSVSLIIIGMVIFYLCEFNNPDTIKGLSLFDQLQVSFFQSVTLRTAGFATVDILSLETHTKLFMCLFMFIGGSPAGTAGGIKTVTFAIVILMIYNIYHGRKEVSIFQRRIKKRLIIRSFAIFAIGLTIAITGLFVLTITENIPFIDLMFESFSAFGTVGLSASVTPILSEVGKIVIILLMFIGRIGPITMILSFARKSQMQGKKTEVGYLDEDVLLG